MNEDIAHKDIPMKRARFGSQTKIKKRMAVGQELAAPRHSGFLNSFLNVVLQLVWTGFMNRDIGQRLKISVRTVEAHRSSMMLKMGVSNTAQLLRQAIQLGLLKTEPLRKKPQPS